MGVFIQCCSSLITDKNGLNDKNCRTPDTNNVDGYMQLFFKYTGDKHELQLPLTLILER